MHSVYGTWGHDTVCGERHHMIVVLFAMVVIDVAENLVAWYSGLLPLWKEHRFGLRTAPAEHGAVRERR